MYSTPVLQAPTRTGGRNRRAHTRRPVPPEGRVTPVRGEKSVQNWAAARAAETSAEGLPISCKATTSIRRARAVRTSASTLVGVGRPMFRVPPTQRPGSRREGGHAGGTTAADQEAMQIGKGTGEGSEGRVVRAGPRSSLTPPRWRGRVAAGALAAGQIPGRTRTWCAVGVGCCACLHRPPRPRRSPCRQRLGQRAASSGRA